MMRVRLLGYPVSNYVNIVRAALIEKQIDHDFVLTRASQDSDFLAISPLGKIPVLETSEGALTETTAILDYLDDAFPATTLRPADPFACAQARQLINIVQLYVEAQVRQLFAGVFMGGVNAEVTEAGVRTMLDRSTATLGQLLKPDPFLLGGRPGQADLFVFYNLDIADRVTRFVYGRSIIDEIGGLQLWIEAMSDRDSTRTIMADFEQCFAEYLASHSAVYSPHDIKRSMRHA
ncbi:glutathione S-transferase family protein [Blastomonas fulva]|uniref:glutathione S-transferase family protein n=1 Tax=Blastomonas fulva TaxID=1550728 RepID=UPI003F72CE55